MPSLQNPFATLIDPAAVLSACTQSGGLDSLPVSARHSADKLRLTDPALERHDAEVDSIYEDLIAKASRSSMPVKAKARARA